MQIGPDKTGMHSWEGVCPVCKVEKCKDCDGGTSQDASLRHDGKYPIIMRPLQTPDRPLPAEMALTACACCGAAYWKEFTRSIALEREAEIEREYEKKKAEELAAAAEVEEERLRRVKIQQEEEAARKKSIFDIASPPASVTTPSESEDSPVEKSDSPLERLRKHRKRKKED